MIKRYLIVGSVAFLSFFAKAQAPKDSASQKVNKTEIEVVYNHYIQNGNNSAITGGIGTEKLIVYAPSGKVKSTFGKNSIALNGGVDLISSASTDNIDYVVSSASRKDYRYYLNGTYEKKFEKQDLSIYVGVGISIESDYYSKGIKLGFTKENKKKLRSYSAEFLLFNDDLRWGRLNGEADFKPTKLIYPSELRTKEWYNTYKRDSYNIKLGFSQVLNKRNILGIYPELSLQKGLLATPFHRIYFSDNTIAVEQLPNERFKTALALKLNSFVAGNVILKNTFNAYQDNFGIKAFAIENETAIKVKPFLTLLPNIRFYTQQGSKYFAPYQAHLNTAEFYTSDYDLSTFQTYSAGIGMRYSPNKYLNKKMMLNGFLFRYNFMYRGNNLSLHSFTFAFQTEFLKPKKTKG